MMENQSFYISKLVQTDFETTVNRVKEELSKVGFGIVSEIDVQEKLKKGADKDINKYLILGACNPIGAFQAIQIEKYIGVMLPCNFIVRETEDGQIEVAAINPEQTIASIGKAEMTALAEEIGAGMRVAIEKI